MAIYKCKMCGGDLIVDESTKICECEYCGTQQTLPRLDNDKKLNLLSRADHFRRNNEYDKAQEIYENILNEDITDAEIYWLIVLCKYGIEYVEDVKTRMRIPTCNRTQMTSIFADENYKKAIDNADSKQQSVYKKEAAEIDQILKEIFAISANEQPFDIFICYKESDEKGNRTKDSVLAQDLYYQLVKEGFKVFFSRITLEDKLGMAYEPYIFSALNSSKVMIVVGTRPEYFNAVWVKNEWSRYLAMIKGGADKVLIPAYKDMDPYDMPKEFSNLQSQDMSKLGFMQDIVRGITKVCGKEDVKQSNLIKNDADEPLIKRAFLCIEDSDFQKADEFLEQALNINPENAETYLMKLLIDLQLNDISKLPNRIDEFKKNPNFIKVLRFAPESKSKEVDNFLNVIYEMFCKEEQILGENINEIIELIRKFEILEGYKDVRNKCEQLRLKCKEIRNKENASVYEELCRQEQEIGEDINKIKNLAKKFEQLGEYKEAKTKSKNLISKGEALEIQENEAKKEKLYNSLCAEMYKKKEIHKLKYCRESFVKLGNYRDSAEKIKECDRMIKKLSMKYLKVLLCGIVVVIVICIISTIKSNITYNKAIEAEADGLRYEAYTYYDKAGNYKDSKSKAEKLLDDLTADYTNALSLYDTGNYSEAYELFVKLGKYENSKNYVKSISNKLEGDYTDAVEEFNDGNYKSAELKFQKLLGYKDSDKYYSKCSDCEMVGHEWLSNECDTICNVCRVQKGECIPGEEAICETNQICTVCGKVLKEAYGHEFVFCDDPVICKNCGFVDDFPSKGHYFIEAESDSQRICAYCGINYCEAKGREHQYGDTGICVDCAHRK